MNGNYFKARVKFSFLTVQLNGMIKKHEVNENKVNTIISIEGPGIAATISTILLLEQNKINWKADYSVEGPLANSLKKYIDTEAEKISRQIIECSISKINNIQS
nr:SRPBCC domain-containing protein [Sulfolobus sp. A20]